MNVTDLIDKLTMLSEGVAKPEVYSYNGPDCKNGLVVMNKGDLALGVIGVVDLDKKAKARPSNTIHCRMPSGGYVDVPIEFGYWFAGLCDGEATLQCLPNFRTVSRRGKEYNTRGCGVDIVIALRDDDESVLEFVRSSLGCGNIGHRCQKKPVKGNGNPVCFWKVSKAEHLKFIIVPVLERCGLQSIKGREFELWKRAVDIMWKSKVYRMQIGRKRSGQYVTDESWNKLVKIESEMKSIRRYKKGSEKCN
jgi:hypothetical protein